MASDPTAEAIGSYFAWRLQQGETWDEAVAAAQRKWPGQNQALFEQGREIAETMEETLTRFAGLHATDRLIDAFGNRRPKTMKVGVRYMFLFEGPGGDEEWRTVTYDAPINISVATLEETMRAKAEQLAASQGGCGGIMLLKGPRAQMVPLNILTVPLPNRIP